MDEIEQMLENKLENTLDSDTSVSHELEIDEEAKELTDTIVGLTGGTSDPDNPDEVVYTGNDQDKGARSAAKCLRVMKMGPEDGLINQGAPFPHLSALAFKKGAEYIGAEVLNDDFGDFVEFNENFDQLLERSEEATRLIGLPSVSIALGRKMEDRLGKTPAELCPNLERGYFGGEVMDENQRGALKEMYGFDNVHEFYALSEAWLVAAAPDETRKLVPLIDEYVFEIENPEDPADITDITELDEIRNGWLLITDYESEGRKLERYSTDDGVEVIPEDGVPRIKVFGRDSTCLNLGGALVHEDSINGAVIYASDEENPDYRAEKKNQILNTPPWKLLDFVPLEDYGIDQRNELASYIFDFFESGERIEVNDYVAPRMKEYPPEALVAEFYLPLGDSFNVEKFLDALYRNAPAMEKVEQLDVVKEIKISDIDSYPTEDEGLKTQKIKDLT